MFVRLQALLPLAKPMSLRGVDGAVPLSTSTDQATNRAVSEMQAIGGEEFLLAVRTCYEAWLRRGGDQRQHDA
jgi:hypothetical protein